MLHFLFSLLFFEVKPNITKKHNVVLKIDVYYALRKKLENQLSICVKHAQTNQVYVFQTVSKAFITNYKIETRSKIEEFTYQ